MNVTDGPTFVKHVAHKPLIGITGLAGSGKDTLGTAVLANFGNPAPISHELFANPLKGMLCMLLNCSRETLERRDFKEDSREGLCGKSPRQLMLSLGTEWGRDMVGDDVWVELAARAWAKAPYGSVFTDVRFDNEAQWIRSEGGIVIEVVRLGASIQPAVAAGHRSEAGIAPHLVSGKVEAAAGDIDGLQSMGLRLIKELGCLSGH